MAVTARSIRQTADAGTASPSQATPQSEDERAFTVPITGHANPLIEAAGPLLVLVARLRRAEEFDGARFARDAAAGIRVFDTRAGTSGVPPDAIRIVRSAVSVTLSQEVAQVTGTHADAAWLGMLSEVLSGGTEAKGVFDAIERLLAKPNANADALEAIAMCLALGLSGPYRGDRSALNRLRDRVWRSVRAAKPPITASSSSPPTDRQREQPLRGYIPLRTLVVGAVVGVMLVLVGARIALDTVSDPVRTRLENAVSPTAVTIVRRAPERIAPSPAVRTQSIAAALKAEIAARQVEVMSSGKQTIVRLIAPGLFAATTANLVERHLPLIDRVAQALASVEDPVTVIGHTDAAPLRSARFPNNALLSLARAEAVRQRLMAAPDLGHHELMAEGRGDSEPLVPETSAAARERNRRIDIVVGPSAED